MKAEADLRLSVDVRPSFHQDLHNLNLTRQRGDVKRCVSLLQSQNMLFTSGPRSEGVDGQTEATRVQQIRERTFQLCCPATVAVLVRGANSAGIHSRHWPRGRNTSWTAFNLLRDETGEPRGNPAGWSGMFRLLKAVKGSDRANLP